MDTLEHMNGFRMRGAIIPQWKWTHQKECQYKLNFPGQAKFGITMPIVHKFIDPTICQTPEKVDCRYFGDECQTWGFATNNIINLPMACKDKPPYFPRAGKGACHQVKLVSFEG